MARIAGVDLPKDKRIEIGLTYVYGIGRTSAKKILLDNSAFWLLQKDLFLFNVYVTGLYKSCFDFYKVVKYTCTRMWRNELG
jgi:hypothetical protein